MREIKFRAWNTQENRMMNDELPNQITLDLPYLKWMQYTNLKDKNGKEIYCSDYLKCDDGKIRKVVWYDLGAGWRVGTNDKDTYFNGLGVYADKLEVVGNEYEGLQNGSEGDIM